MKIKILFVTCFLSLTRMGTTTCPCKTTVENHLRILIASRGGYSSCSAILASRPRSPSGTYTLTYESGQSEEVFCFMGALPGCGEGGWRRIGLLDRTQGQECPSSLTEFNQEVTACSFTGGGGCHSILFSTNNQNYTHVCGRVRGYSFGSPDSFARFGPVGDRNNIDTPYLDGISITYGNPRKHLWSYVSSQVNQNNNIECPCSSGPTTVSPPSFVGNNYYCESGGGSGNPLWDGKQCNAIENSGTCCSRPDQPWFHRTIGETNDMVELRLCRDEGFELNENIPVDQYEIYVQ